MRRFKLLLVIFLIIACYSGYGQSMDFNFQVWVKTEIKDTTFPMIVGNKQWDSGKIVDFTSNQNFGEARSTGSLKGWSIFLQPNGAWGWNIGDGEKRLDYLPTARRQRINDGALHYLAFSVDVSERAVWLYRDGDHVAIYSLDELGLSAIDLDNLLDPDIPNDGFHIEILEVRKGILSPIQARNNWRSKFPKQTRKAPPARDSMLFNVMAWNIWHGGRRDGIQEGLDKTVSVIRKNKPDIICMQETYGSGPILADRLNMMYYYRSSNLSVFSKYPVLETQGWYDPFRFGGLTLELPTGQKLRVFSLWIHYLPDLDKQVKDAAGPAEILAAEMKTRGTEIKDIISNLPDLLAETDSIPLLIAGDFNSPSHLDWGEDMKSEHRDMVVTWPVSEAMAKAGFKDAFRLIYPDPQKNYGRTWSPRFTDGWQDRIDYIYFTDQALQCIDAKMLDQHPEGWPSDHAAVWGRFKSFKQIKQ